MKTEKVLITGENGFIALNLFNYLKSKNLNVECVSMRNIDIDENKEIDLKKADILIHCAAIVHKNERKIPIEQYYKINSKLTYKLAKKHKENGGYMFIYLSSMSVYGLKEGIIDENTIPNPITKYGKSKLKGEKLILPLVNDNYKIAILRPPLVYGENCGGNYNLMRKIINILPVFPLVHNEKSVISIENLLDFIYDIIQKGENGIFFPQDNEYADICKMAENIAREMKKKIFYSEFLGFVVKKLNFNIFIKAFGNLVYDKNMKKIEISKK